MGNMTNSWTVVSRRAGLIVGLSCAFLWACASGGGQESDRASRVAAAEPAVDAARLESVRVLDSGEGARLELMASAPLIWTQYRDPEGRLVVELPNTVLAPGITEPAGAGIVESVVLASVDGESRPLTRVTVATTTETEHELGSEGKTLVLDLVPVAGAPEPERTLAYEPLGTADPVETGSLEEETLEEPVAAPSTSLAEREPAPVVTPLGTPEAPRLGPAPSGVVASRLDRVEVVSEDGEPVVRIYGDGDFRYSTFALADPTRFVVDLHGVTNLASQATIPAGAGDLERVRVAQFKGDPEAISRVVLDLSDGSRPMLEPTGDGLLIRLGSGAARPASLAAAAGPVTESVPATGTAEVAEISTDEPATPDEAPVYGTREEPADEPADEPAERLALASPEPAPSDRFEEIEVAEDDMPIESPAESEAIVDVAQPPAPRAEPISSMPRTPVPEPTDVALFEAQDVEDPVVVELAERPQGETFEAQEVTAGERRYVGEPISFSLKDADIREVLRTFAKISGLNMVVQPGVSGSVTVELEQVPWDQALDIILKTNNLGYELEGNIMRVAPRSVLAQEAQQEAERARARALAVPLKTVLKRVSYSDAQSIATLLRSGGARLLSERGSVVVDPRTNTLIIKELPEVMDTVLSVIDQIDVPEPQVMIEARIVETTKDFSRSLGIEWGFTGIADAEHGNTTGLQFPNNVSADGGVSVLTGGANGFIDLSLGNILNTFVLDARLQAAESEGLVNILSAPRVATLNNATAEIQSGLQIPIQTVSNNTVTVQFVNATLRLNVTPHVTAEGTVLMDIDVQKREPQLAFAVAGAANAPISTKQARTRVIVRDGGTTVIGGIYKVTTNSGQDRVPGLANIPILGHLFKNRRESHQNDELLIFITPRVIKL